MSEVQSLGPCDPIIDCAPGSSCVSDKLFAAIYVKPKIVGGAVVFWTLGPNNLTGPLSFSLEVNHAGHALADEWEVVTDFAVETTWAVDPRHRSSGWYQRTYYRVVIRDAKGNLYHSVAIPANQGRLNAMQQSLYREIVRREQKRYGLRNTPSTPGYLLKIKYYGPRCTLCIDPDSGESFGSSCDNCYGTGYERGFHPAYPCFNVDINTVSHDLTMYSDQGPVITGGTTSIRFFNNPPVHPWDIWVDATSDYRYLIGMIQPLTSFGELDIVCIAAASRLRFNHPAYRIPLDGTWSETITL